MNKTQIKRSEQNSNVMDFETLRDYLRLRFEGMTANNEKVRKIEGLYSGLENARLGGVAVGRDIPFLNERTATILTSTILGAMVNAHPELSLLANEIFYRKVGCQIIEDVKTNYRMVDETVTPAAAWTTEAGTGGTESEYDDYNEVTPHTLVAANTYSRRVAKTVPPQVVELFIRRLIYARDLLIDSAVLYGSGTGNEPLGIKNHPDVSVQSGASLGKAELDEIERIVDAGEAPWEGRYYLIHPTLAKTLKSRPVISGGQKTLLYNHPTGQLYLNNYPAIITPRVEATDLFFGHFNSVMITFFGYLEVITKMLARTGDVVATLLDEADVTVRRSDWLAVYQNIT